MGTMVAWSALQSLDSPLSLTKTYSSTSPRLLPGPGFEPCGAVVVKGLSPLQLEVALEMRALVSWGPGGSGGGGRCLGTSWAHVLRRRILAGFLAA